jgi:hypothetical protein
MPVHAGARDIIAVANARCQRAIEPEIAVVNRRVGAAQIGIQIFRLDAPVRSDHPFDAAADSAASARGRIGIGRRRLRGTGRSKRGADRRIAGFDFADRKTASHVKKHVRRGREA